MNTNYYVVTGKDFIPVEGPYTKHNAQVVSENLPDTTVKSEAWLLANGYSTVIDLHMTMEIEHLNRQF